MTEAKRPDGVGGVAECATCVFWESVDHAESTVRIEAAGLPVTTALHHDARVRVGACKRWPPAPSLVTHAPNVGSFLGRWPLTPADTWCGEYCSKHDPRRPSWDVGRMPPEGAVRKPPAEGAG